MKTIKTNSWSLVCAAIMMLIGVGIVPADQATTTPAKPENRYTGTVVSVNPQEQVLDVKGFWFSKKFNVGADYACTLLDDKTGTINDLRPGEKVMVGYQNANGVLIADRVEQEPMRYEGMVQAVDPAAHTLTLHVRGMNKTFQIANDCGVVLRDNKPGALADIQTGNHVTVTYETPGNALLARQIAQTSIEFTGRLTAIDLENKTLKAKSAFSEKKFNVADNCAIVLNGRPGGRLSDLKPDDNLAINYNEINGVNVVNRIAPAEAQPKSVASSASSTSPY